MHSSLHIYWFFLLAIHDVVPLDYGLCPCMLRSLQGIASDAKDRCNGRGECVEEAMVLPENNDDLEASITSSYAALASFTAVMALILEENTYGTRTLVSRIELGDQEVFLNLNGDFLNLNGNRPRTWIHTLSGSLTRDHVDGDDAKSGDFH